MLNHDPGSLGILCDSNSGKDALAFAPIQDGVVQTRPSPIEGPAAAAPAGTALRSLERNCLYGGQPTICPTPQRSQEPAEAADPPSQSSDELWSWLAGELTAAGPPGETDMERYARDDRERQAQDVPVVVPPTDTPRQDRSSDSNGCRTETVRSDDGMSVSTSVRCGSGDTRLLDEMMDSMRARTAPPTCDQPFSGEDKAGYLARCGGNPY